MNLQPNHQLMQAQSQSKIKEVKISQLFGASTIGGQIRKAIKLLICNSKQHAVAAKTKHLTIMFGYKFYA